MRESHFLIGCKAAAAPCHDKHDLISSSSKITHRQDIAAFNTTNPLRCLTGRVADLQTLAKLGPPSPPRFEQAIALTILSLDLLTVALRRQCSFSLQPVPKALRAEVTIWLCAQVWDQREMFEMRHQSNSSGQGCKHCGSI